MVDGLSVSCRRSWRPTRQRRGRRVIAQPGAAKSVAFRRPACAAARFFWDRRAQPSACENARVALTEGKSPAPKVGLHAHAIACMGFTPPGKQAQRAGVHRPQGGTMEARKGRDGKKPARCQARQRGSARPGDAKKICTGSSDRPSKSMAHWLDRRKKRDGENRAAIGQSLPDGRRAAQLYQSGRRCMATRCCIALK